MVKQYTKRYYSWGDIVDGVETLTGKRINDWANSSSQPFGEKPEIPYRNFWHWWIEYNPLICNGSINVECFGDALEWAKTPEANEPPWVVEVLEAICIVVGPSIAKREVNIEYSW